MLGVSVDVDVQGRLSGVLECFFKGGKVLCEGRLVVYSIVIVIFSCYTIRIYALNIVSDVMIFFNVCSLAVVTYVLRDIIRGLKSFNYSKNIKTVLMTRQLSNHNMTLPTFLLQGMACHVAHYSYSMLHTLGCRLC